MKQTEEMKRVIKVGDWRVRPEGTPAVKFMLTAMAEKVTLGPEKVFPVNNRFGKEEQTKGMEVVELEVKVMEVLVRVAFVMFMV